MELTKLDILKKKIPKREFHKWVANLMACCNENEIIYVII